jgi:hypothetical protein
MPAQIDWTKLVEAEDTTKSSQEPACAADGCEINAL